MVLEIFNILLLNSLSGLSHLNHENLSITFLRVIFINVSEFQAMMRTVTQVSLEQLAYEMTRSWGLLTKAIKKYDYTHDEVRDAILGINNTNPLPAWIEREPLVYIRISEEDIREYMQEETRANFYLKLAVALTAQIDRTSLKDEQNYIAFKEILANKPHLISDQKNRFGSLWEYELSGDKELDPFNDSADHDTPTALLPPDDPIGSNIKRFTKKLFPDHNRQPHYFIDIAALPNYRQGSVSVSIDGREKDDPKEQTEQYQNATLTAHISRDNTENICPKIARTSLVIALEMMDTSGFFRTIVAPGWLMDSISYRESNVQYRWFKAQFSCYDMGYIFEVVEKFFGYEVSN